jgi:hypothetical protein
MACNVIVCGNIARGIVDATAAVAVVLIVVVWMHLKGLCSCRGGSLAPTHVQLHDDLSNVLRGIALGKHLPRRYRRTVVAAHVATRATQTHTHLSDGLLPGAHATLKRLALRVLDALKCGALHAAHGDELRHRRSC